MAVKAKFRCSSVTNFEHSKQIAMNAVYGTGGENADFTKATPWGELKMNIDSDVPAADQFKPGEDYYLTFEKVLL